jgi:hypothetical protein
MSFDPRKISQAPWHYSDDAHGTEDDPALWFDHPELGRTAVVTYAFWEHEDLVFVAAARNAFEIRRKRGWYAIPRGFMPTGEPSIWDAWAWPKKLLTRTDGSAFVS